jgi:hypothetical protein
VTTRIPGSNTLYLFLWGNLKYRVQKTKQEAYEQPKVNTENFIRCITVENLSITGNTVKMDTHQTMDNVLYLGGPNVLN